MVIMNIDEEERVFVARSWLLLDFLVDAFASGRTLVGFAIRETFAARFCLRTRSPYNGWRLRSAYGDF